MGCPEPDSSTACPLGWCEPHFPAARLWATSRPPLVPPAQVAVAACCADPSLGPTASSISVTKSPPCPLFENPAVALSCCLTPSPQLVSWDGSVTHRRTEGWAACGGRGQAVRVGLGPGRALCPAPDGGRRSGWACPCPPPRGIIRGKCSGQVSPPKGDSSGVGGEAGG